MVERRYDHQVTPTSFAMGTRRKHPLLLSLCIAVLLLAPWTCCFGQNSLRSEITPQSGHIDDLFIFAVTFEGSQERITPQIAAGGDFEIQLLGPRTSISIVNGQVHSRQQFVYQLSPKREGDLQTPEVQANVDGQLLSAPPIAVSIKSSSGQPAPSPSSGSEQIFMRQTASPESAYVGQQIVNAITVYTRVNLRGVRIDDEAADGFWQEMISDGNNAQRTVNGVEYGSAQILRAMFALKQGQLPIPARHALVQVPVTKRGNPLGSLDPFSDDFFENFFQRTVVQEKKLTSNELSLTIRPLPPLPPDLSQFTRGLTIVGNTSISTNVAETALHVGESKNISITLSSTGHLNPVKMPPLKVPPGIKLYDGQTTVKHDTGQGSLVTHKTFNYSVVPTQPGLIRIPGISIAYFDPDSESYKLTTSGDISLAVSGTPLAQTTNSASDVGVTPPTSTGAPSLADSNQASQGQGDLAPAATMPYVEKTRWEQLSERVSIQLALLILAAAITFIGLLSIVLRPSSAQVSRTETLRKISKATSLDDLELCVRSWANGSLPGLRPGATFDEIRAVIRSSARDGANALALIAVLDQLEVARYAGASSPSIDKLKRSLQDSIRSWR
jgi:hypothetical protein